MGQVSRAPRHDSYCLALIFSPDIKMSPCFSNDAEQLSWTTLCKTGIYQMDTYNTVFLKRLPAYNIFHALPSISGVLFSSLDILLRGAMKLIN